MADTCVEETVADAGVGPAGGGCGKPSNRLLGKCVGDRSWSLGLPPGDELEMGEDNEDGFPPSRWGQETLVTPNGPATPGLGSTGIAAVSTCGE